MKSKEEEGKEEAKKGFIKSRLNGDESE